MSARVVVSAMLTALGLAAGNAVAENSPFSFSGTATSDYVFRGISQNDENPALQGGATYTHHSGLYAGVWGSQVDFGEALGADLEVDAFGGYRKVLNPSWTADIQLIRYIYPSTADGVDLDFNELVGVIAYQDRYKLSVGWSNDVFNTSESGLFVAGSAMFTMPHECGIEVGVGRYSFDDEVFDGAADSYSYMSLGLTRVFGPVTATLSHFNTNADAEALFGSDLAGSRVALSLTYNF